MPVWVNDNYEKLVIHNLEERQGLGYANRESGIYYMKIPNLFKMQLKYCFCRSKFSGKKHNCLDFIKKTVTQMIYSTFKSNCL